MPEDNKWTKNNNAIVVNRICIAARLIRPSKAAFSNQNKDFGHGFLYSEPLDWKQCYNGSPMAFFFFHTTYIPFHGHFEWCRSVRVGFIFIFQYNDISQIIL